MTDDKCVQFFRDALDVAGAYGETPASIAISYRIWEGLTRKGVLDPQDPWRPDRVTYKGTQVLVSPEFPEERVLVHTKEELHLIRVMDEMRTRALRDTGVAPVAYELGAAKFALYERARHAVALRFRGIPVKKVHNKADYVGIRLFAAAPDWCKVGSCVARRDNDAIWGKVVEVQSDSYMVVVRNLVEEVDTLVSYLEMRDQWQVVPARIVPKNRFHRILGPESVSIDE